MSALGNISGKALISREYVHVKFISYTPFLLSLIDSFSAALEAKDD